MEKINLPFFYQLGAQLNRLTEFTVDPKNRGNILLASFRAYTNVLRLFDEFSTLTVCRATGEELMEAIDDIEKWWKEASTEKFNEPDSLIEIKFQKVIDKAKRFETVLSAELETLATYHVTQKGIYDTTALIARTENVLPKSMLNRIDQGVVVEIRESGKCLAFDCATASGFHIMRATELILHKYYLHICNPKSKKRLANWGAYIEKLKLVGDPEVEEVVAMLQQTKDRHRNLIMHPEIVLTIDEAFTLFEIAQGVIIAMASALPIPKNK